MAYINVNYNQILKAADEVDAYIIKQKQSMKEIDRLMLEMNTKWTGKDSSQLYKEWSEMKSEKSSSAKMLYSLEEYSASLKYAAKRYREAQQQAINRASRYCR